MEERSLGEDVGTLKNVYGRKNGIRAPGRRREILSTALARPADAARQDYDGYKNPGGETVLAYMWLGRCRAIRRRGTA